MTLPYGRLASFSLGCIVTTLIITTHAPQHQSRPVADAPTVPQDRCNQTNASIIHALTTGP
jgi:hypothetical protein